MEPRSRAEVHVVVRVMRPMEGPQNRNTMQHVVLDVVDQIEDANREHERHPAWDGHVVEQTPTAFGAKKRPPKAHHWEKGPHENRVEDGKREIAEPSQPE